MHNPKITIITPSYNQGQYIEQTIKSIVEEQNYDNIEYIIIDGGSTDETIDVIKKYEDKITFWVSEKDGGQTDAINKGWQKATGDIITWLCSDDYYEANILGKVVDAFKNENTNLVCGNRRTFGDGINDTPYIGWRTGASLEETMVKGSYDQPPSFFRKEAWDAIFPLSENLRVYMDTEMWLRYLLVYGDKRATHIDELFANGRFHADSKSMNEAVPCRYVINSLYHSIAKTVGLDKSLIDKLTALERKEYEGKWEVKAKIDKHRLTHFITKRFEKQFQDKSYLYRDVASYFMYLGNPKASMVNARKAIKVAPTKLINYRTYLYSLRRRVFG